MSPMALEGIKILDLTIWQQGPVATQLLGDLGADILKIEDALYGDPSRGVETLHLLPPAKYNYYFELQNRNKRSVGINMRKQPKSTEIIYRLIQKADCFVSNLSYATLDDWKLDFESMSKFNPSIVWCHVNTYGHLGPERDIGGFDINGKARSGLCSVIGPDEVPFTLTPLTTADQNGAFFLAFAVLTGLIARDKHGIGQKVETSMLAAELFRGGLLLQGYLASGMQPPKYNRDNMINPLFCLYKAKDGKGLVLSMPQTDRWWPIVCRALRREDLLQDPRFDSNSKRCGTYCKELIAIFDQEFLKRGRDEWITYLKSREVLCDPISEYSEVEKDTQVLNNDYIITVDHPVFGRIKQPGIPIHCSKTPGRVRTIAPEVGQHTEEVLLDYGFAWEELEQLKRDGVIT